MRFQISSIDRAMAHKGAIVMTHTGRTFVDIISRRAGWRAVVVDVVCDPRP
jgi:hypothetical protein